MYNPYVITILVLALGGVLIFYVFRKVGTKPIIKDNVIDPAYILTILETKVPLYGGLNAAHKQIFQERVDYFLKRTRITAEKGAHITDEDKVLVAASATIPLIHYEKWAYENLDEVILYPDYFDERFDVDNPSGNVAGMVGAGAMDRKMILSLPSLRSGYTNHDSGNTAIHEFVHLIDKADGAVDGVPEYLIPKNLIEPWMKEMHKTIREIREGRSDIRDYGGTNEAEFLAVISEYFFKKPKALQVDHPQLYTLLDEIYNRED